MADLRVDANITAPRVVNVPLVRADLLGMSTTFRICFEVALAIASAALGSLINTPSPIPPAQWILLVLSSLAAIAFLMLDNHCRTKALESGDGSEPSGP